MTAKKVNPALIRVNPENAKIDIKVPEIDPKIQNPRFNFSASVARIPDL